MAFVAQKTRGGLRVQELLDTASLQLELIVGAGGLDRRASWTHVSELEDPTPWLDGGELLFTMGLGLPLEGKDQATYVRRLVESRVAALAIGVRHPPIQPEMLAEAERLDFPVLKVGRQVPFLPIARMVAVSATDVAQQRLATHLRIFNTLSPQGSEQRSNAELFSLLEGITGQRLYLVSRHGKPALQGLAEPPDWVVNHLRSTEDSRYTIPGGRVVPVPVGERTVAYLVALERENRKSAGVTAIGHVAIVAALRLTEDYRERELDRRRGSELLADLLSGGIPPADAQAALVAAGFDVDAPIVLAAAHLHEGSDGTELHHRLLDKTVPHLMLEQRELYLLLPSTEAVLSILGAEEGVRAGVSRPVNGRLTDLALFRREALWSLHRAYDQAGPPVVRFEEKDAFAHWLPPDFTSLEELVARILGPIIEYDVEHRTELLATLASSFRNQRKLALTASELLIHKHTLAYRLSRIEQLTGRQFSSVGDQALLWLALRAFAIVHPDRVNQDPRLLNRK